DHLDPANFVRRESRRTRSRRLPQATAECLPDLPRSRGVPSELLRCRVRLDGDELVETTMVLDQFLVRGRWLVDLHFFRDALAVPLRIGTLETILAHVARRCGAPWSGFWIVRAFGGTRRSHPRIGRDVDTSHLVIADTAADILAAGGCTCARS